MKNLALRTEGLALPTFNLSRLWEQVLHDSRYADWSRERFDAAIEAYRQYLARCKAETGSMHVAEEDVDVIWHKHILNTEQYARNCNSYFGYFLHHRPETRQDQCCLEPPPSIGEDAHLAGRMARTKALLPSALRQIAPR